VNALGTLSVLTVLGALLVSCAASTPLQNSPNASTLGEKMAREAFAAAAQPLAVRAKQDRSQELCGMEPGQRAEIARLANSSMRYPASGILLGDWKLGEKIALDGSGERIRGGRVESAKQNGGNCYACHALDPAEVNAGNLGPNLSRYGAQRGASDALIKYTYEKIYNAWAFSPCSSMPRLGASGYLTLDQITHVVAYLIDPASPVNARAYP
jgi:sulfur-oxidizing protein SoxX